MDGFKLEALRSLRIDVTSLKVFLMPVFSVVCTLIFCVYILSLKKT
jgi:hypothetical protein